MKIGILSAVALPQYTKAVEKARMSEALTALSSLSKAMDLYKLENPDGYANFVGDWTDGLPKQSLDVDMESSLNCPANDEVCYSKHFAYYATCNESWCFAVARSRKGDYSLHYVQENSNWEKECWCYTDTGLSLCQSMANQGWTLEDER